MSTDRETAWKELLEHEPEHFLSFFYPDVCADLDWTHETDWLEQEFRKVAHEALTGTRLLDKLLRAVRNDTDDLRFLHFEIQSYVEADFARRVYVYNTLAEIRFGQPVVSLPILIDDDPNWLPDQYEAELYGTKRLLTFRPIKVIALPRSEAELEADPNPVGLFVLAFLLGRRHEGDHEALLTAKVRLIRLLSARTLTEAEANRWENYLDWLLPLPESYNARLREALAPVPREFPMSFFAYLRRVTREEGLDEGRKEGRREGLIAAVALGLDLKFGQQGAALVPEVEKVEDLAVLQAVYDAIKPAQSLDDVRKLLPVPTNGQG